MSVVIEKLTSDLKQAAAGMTRDEARFLVKNYYIVQDQRKRSDSQTNSMETGSQVLHYLSDISSGIEKQVKALLDIYTDNQEIGRWMKAIDGIGPVISAGFIAHIDISRVKSVGQIYQFAGLNPECEWLGKERAENLMKTILAETDAPGQNDWLSAENDENLALAELINNYQPAEDSTSAEDKFFLRLKDLTGRGYRYLLENSYDEDGKFSKKKLTSALAKRPYNADLKTLCWKVGQSFMKVSNKPNDVYGKIYKERRLLETERNERLEFADQAEAVLKKKKFDKSTEAYKFYSVGKLPPAHILARAERYAVKFFLSHLFTVWYTLHNGIEPPKPYVLEHLGHVDYVAPPYFDGKKVILPE